MDFLCFKRITGTLSGNLDVAFYDYDFLFYSVFLTLYSTTSKQSFLFIINFNIKLMSNYIFLNYKDYDILKYKIIFGFN